MPAGSAERTWVLVLTAALVMSVLGAPAVASSVAPMTVPEMADWAGQVVVGQVASVRSYWADNPSRIETEVTLTNLGYLKGVHTGASETFSMIVPGGTVGELQMQVCCAPKLEQGQKWLLFVLPTYKTFPVVGLYRGAFQIKIDQDGIERVFSSAAEPVLGIEAGGAVLVRDVSRHRPAGASTQLEELAAISQNARINLATPERQPLEAVSFEAFVTQIQPMLDQSVNHQLTAPAGRRVLVEYHASTLKPSPTSLAMPKGNSADLSSALRGMDRVTESPPANRTRSTAAEAVRP